MVMPRFLSLSTSETRQTYDEGELCGLLLGARLTQIIRCVCLNDAPNFLFINRYVIGEPSSPGLRSFRKPPKRFVVASEIIQLLGQCVTERDTSPLVHSVGGDERLELNHVIDIRSLPAQLRPQ